MRLKARAAVIVAAFCVMTFPVSAHGWGLKKTGEAQTAQAQQNSGYIFRSGTADIVMDAEAGPVLAALGATTKPVYEVDSCAYQGKDRLYTYDGLEVSTNVRDGKERIASLLVKGKDLATPEGLKIGAKESEITKLYGSVSPSFGIYRYLRGNTELSIYTTAGVVDEIEYIVVLK